MITINDIIAFVEKAMQENLNIRKWDNFEELSITIYDPEEYPNGFSISCFSENNSSKIQMTETYSNWVDIETSEMDIAQFRVLVLKADEYSKNKVIEKFKNFFNNETREKILNINNLNDDD